MCACLTCRHTPCNPWTTQHRQYDLGSTGRQCLRGCPMNGLFCGHAGMLSADHSPSLLIQVFWQGFCWRAAAIYGAMRPNLRPFTVYIKVSACFGYCYTCYYPAHKVFLIEACGASVGNIPRKLPRRSASLIQVSVCMATGCLLSNLPILAPRSSLGHSMKCFRGIHQIIMSA